MVEWTTALPDWEARILARQSLLPCGPLFPDEAAAAMEVFNSLRIVDVPGCPTIGESCRPWIGGFAEVIFGAYDNSSGRRLIRDFGLLVSKKNTKSTLAAGIMLTALIRNWRQSAEYVILAPTIEVAKNAFKPARDMVKADDELDELFQVQDHLRTITHRQSGATLKVVAADNDTVSGKKATGVLIDELWLFGKRDNAENMLREATGGLASRPEGFVIWLSTQADDPPAGVFKQKLDYFRDIRDGKIVNPRALGVLYEFPQALIDSKAYLEPANFYVTNPNLGLSVDEEFLTDEYAKAVAAGEESVKGFTSKHLNVQIGMNLRSGRWAGADHWEKQADKALTLDEVLARSDVVTIGVDGGGLDDLLGLAVLGRDKVTRDWLLWVRAWMHNGVLQRRKEEAPRFRDFEKDGDLVIVEDLVTAYADVAKLAQRVDAAGLLAAVCLDPVGVTAIVDELSRLGITQESDQVVGVSQGYKLTGTIKTLEVKLSGGSCRHAGQALMSWCVGNAKVVPTGNAVLITKQVSGSGKIDPLMAALDAASFMATNPEPKGSVYSAERGLTFF